LISRWRALALALLLTGLLGLGACGGGTQRADRGTTQAGQINPHHYNVVLFVFDGMRAGDTSLYGYARNTTPNLRTFAQQATLFRDAVAPSSWALPSAMSIFTGLYPSMHGLVNRVTVSSGASEPARLRDGIVTLPQYLGEKGFHLEGYCGGADYDASYGFDHGFKTYAQDLKYAGLEHTVTGAVDFLRRYKQQPSNQPFFLFVQGYDASFHYEPPDGYQHTWSKGYHGPLHGTRQEAEHLEERALRNKFEPNGGGEPHLESRQFKPADAAFYRALYDERIRLADQRFGALLREMDALDLTDDTVFVVLSDHGEEFLEHGSLGHGASMYDEVMHVPMLIKLPHTPASAVYQRVSTIDALPTVLDYFGVAPPTRLDGTSLLPLINGQATPDRPLYAETDYRLYSHKRCCWLGDYQVIYSLDSHRTELYNVSQDAAEKHDLAHTDSAATTRMRGELGRWLDTLPSYYPDYAIEPADVLH
jgi:arylsulfatase A-like enzyme